MRKNTGYVLRIALGGYLTWIGISLLIQTLNERPSNTIFVCAAAGVFIVAGGLYVIYSLIKMSGVKFKFKIKEKSGTEEEKIKDEKINEYAGELPPVQIKLEKESEIERQQEAKTQVVTVEFPRADVESDNQAKENMPPAKEESKEEAKEEPKEEPKEEQPDAILTRKGVEVVELSDKEEPQEAEDIETDYEEK